MQPERIYLDWNATAPLRPEARRAAIAALDLCGNPSSVHREGRAARAIMEDARGAVAGAVGAASADVIFTSGATEANVLALTPNLRRDGGAGVARLIVSAVEHASVLAGGRFAEQAVARVPVDRSGRVDLDALRQTLAKGVPALVSVMLANNETGAIQPIAEIADLVHGAGGLLHVDAVAAFGKIDIDMRCLGADLLSISGHKIGGPKGVGALVAAPSLSGLEPGLRGGGQEKGRRAGTENLAGIAGFGAAVTATVADLPAEADRLAGLQRRLETGLRQTRGLVVVCGDVPRVPNTTLFAVPAIRAETTVIGLDLAGVAVSSGSACSSGKVQSSHVLAAMGYGPDIAGGGIRVSTGWSSSEEEIDRAVEAWRKLAGTLIKKDDETVLERF